MIRHVVLLTFKPEISPGEVDAIADELRSLSGQISAIEEYEIGLGMNAGNATMAIVGLFADEARFKEYREHPAHRAVAQNLLVPATESSASAQFEC